VLQTILGDDTKKPYLLGALKAVQEYESFAVRDGLPLDDFLSVVLHEHENYTAHRTQALQKVVFESGSANNRTATLAGIFSFRHFVQVVQKMPGGSSLTRAQLLQLFHDGLERSDSDHEVTVSALVSLLPTPGRGHVEIQWPSLPDDLLEFVHAGVQSWILTDAGDVEVPEPETVSQTFAAMGYLTENAQHEGREVLGYLLGKAETRLAHARVLRDTGSDQRFRAAADAWAATEEAARAFVLEHQRRVPNRHAEALLKVSLSEAQNAIDDLTSTFKLGLSDIVIMSMGSSGVSDLVKGTNSSRERLEELWRLLDDVSVYTKSMFLHLER
jgi:hypothetical protein